MMGMCHREVRARRRRLLVVPLFRGRGIVHAGPVRSRQLTRDGVRLRLRDSGTSGKPVLLLHGLGGHAREWDATAASLRPTCRILALDQRGHGRSDRRPPDVSRAAYVADAVAVVERLCDEPVALVGQSLGGHTAFLVAAARPDLVASLVVAEATAGGPNLAAVERVREWLASWPTPFPSRGQALSFFGGDNTVARAWVSGLRWADSGWSPRFDVDVMTACLRAAEERSWWDEWASIRCPALIVRGGHGILAHQDLMRMVATVPPTRVVTLEAAGHEVHLEDPDAWYGAIAPFLADPGA